MKAKLTERVVKAAEIGHRKYVLFDEDCPGFGLCVYLSGRKGFVLIYRIAGQQKRFTIGVLADMVGNRCPRRGAPPDREIDRGVDPLDVARRTVRRPHSPNLQSATSTSTCRNWRRRAGLTRSACDEKLILPEWKSARWRTSRHRCRSPADQDRGGRARPSKEGPDPEAAQGPQACEAHPDPCQPCGRSHPQDVQPRRPLEDADRQSRLRLPQAARDGPGTVLSFEEIERLANALAVDEDQRSAGIIRLCMLTGARLGEVRTATFDQFNLDLAIWTKQAAYTKQRRVHRVPISHEAVALIRLRKQAVPEGFRSSSRAMCRISRSAIPSGSGLASGKWPISRRAHT